MADAIAKRSSVIVAPGFFRSDYTVQLAAAAHKLDMKCVLAMEEDLTEPLNIQQRGSGTVWLDDLYRADIHYFPRGYDLDGCANDLGDQLHALGQSTYVIPRGGSSPVGVLGGVNFAIEIAKQLRDQGLRIDCVVLASDSGAMQAGLIVGFQLATMPIRVLGISVNTQKLKQEDRVYKLIGSVSDYLQLRRPPSKNNVFVNSDYTVDESDSPTQRTLMATAEVARQEGILLNPANTGRAMGGLIDLIVNKQRFATRENILFLHTDGTASLCRYSASLAEALGNDNQY